MMPRARAGWARGEGRRRHSRADKRASHAQTRACGGPPRRRWLRQSGPGRPPGGRLCLRRTLVLLVRLFLLVLLVLLVAVALEPGLGARLEDGSDPLHVRPRGASLLEGLLKRTGLDWLKAPVRPVVRVVVGDVEPLGVRWFGAGHVAGDPAWERLAAVVPFEVGTPQPRWNRRNLANEAASSSMVRLVVLYRPALRREGGQQGHAISCVRH